MASTSKAPSIVGMILDNNVPIEHRCMMLRHFCQQGGDAVEPVLKELLKAAAGKSRAVYKKKAAELDKFIHELKDGALRPATFVKVDVTGRGLICLDDGPSALLPFLDPQLKKDCSCGDQVLVDKDVHAIIERWSDMPPVGREASLVRPYADDSVEVDFGNDDKHVYLAAEPLKQRLAKDEIRSGSSLLVHPRQQIAYDVIADPEGSDGFAFLDRSPIPEVSIEEDIGNPPAYLDDLSEHVRQEMLNPESQRRYRLPKTITVLLTGPSGTGKTLSIEGFIRRMSETVSEITGAPLEELPPRVVRVRMSQVLSKWLGESDKTLDRFFDEVIRLHDQPFVGPDGREFNLPVLAIGEEIEGLSRARGTDHDSVYDRIQTVALQRLDMTRPEYKNRLIIYICTSNVPHLIDSAFMRRAGSSIVRFGRLTDIHAFQAVLNKHIKDLPFCPRQGFNQQKLEQDACQKLSAWLFCQDESQRPLVEIDCAGAQPLFKHRYDFLTGAMVDQAVNKAAREACRNEQFGFEPAGLTPELLIKTFDEQILSTVSDLKPQNIEQYVDLPDGVRVTQVRHLQQPSYQSLELMRAS